jgi:hypothetical protein
VLLLKVCAIALHAQVRIYKSQPTLLSLVLTIVQGSIKMCREVKYGLTEIFMHTKLQQNAAEGHIYISKKEEETIQSRMKLGTIYNPSILRESQLYN